MNYTLSDKLMAYMTLAAGLIISTVAIWYSVAGLAAIFAAAAIPIIVMGVVLEISKLVATVWLKWNWKRAPWHIKSYLITAIAVLMLITSMGIFGFLSKAHLDQAVPTGEVSSQVALIDEKINNERETINNARTLLGQLDKAVADISASPDREVNGRSVSSAERALQVRRQQARDRENLTKTIEAAQARIVKLQEEKAPIASQLRAVEAEVGPIKYVAALIYGDNPDANLLERAVRWVIIIIVLVFDPLAVALLLASQYSFQWLRQEKNDSRGSEPPGGSSDKELSPIQPSNGGIATPLISDPEKDKIVEESFPEPEDTGYPKDNPWPFPTEKDTTNESENQPKEKSKDKTEEANSVLSEIEEPVDIDRILDTYQEPQKTTPATDDSITETIDSSEKTADYGLEAKPDYLDPAVDEATKWAEETLQWAAEQKAKAGYVQNAEQSQSTVWQKIKAVKNN